jgi:hypothetical protein
VSGFVWLKIGTVQVLFLYCSDTWGCNNYTGQQISNNFLIVTNMLLIYLFASMKLEKGHKKNYLALDLNSCYNYDILQNRLKYYTKRWFK